VGGIKYSFPYWIYSTAWTCNGTELSIPSQYGKGARDDYRLSRDGRNFKEKSTRVGQKSVGTEKGRKEDGSYKEPIYVISMIMSI
jgi:hypothetical protein